MEITDAIRQDLETKYGEDGFVVLEAATGEQAAFRTPTVQEFQRFMDESGDRELKGICLRNLVAACVVVPDLAGWNALLKKRPGLVVSFGNELTEHAGMKRATVRKK